MTRRSLSPLWIGLGLLVLAVITLNVLLFRPRPVVLPAGWTVVNPPEDVMTLALAGGTLYAAGRNGVVAFDVDSPAVIRTIENDPPFAYVKGLAADADGALWIAHEKGLTRIVGATRRTWTTQDGLPALPVTAVLVARNGRILIGTEKGLAELDGERITPIGPTREQVSALAEDGGGAIWFGTNAAPRGGLFHLDAANQQRAFFSVATGLPHNSVCDIRPDGDSGLLVATGLIYEGGLARLARSASGWTLERTWRRDDGLAGEKSRSIFRDSRGVLWCGSEYDGLAVSRDGATWRVVTSRDGLPHNEVRSVVEDRSGAIWLGTMGGLLRIDTSAIERLVTD